MKANGQTGYKYEGTAALYYAGYTAASYRWYPINEGSTQLHLVFAPQADPYGDLYARQYYLFWDDADSGTFYGYERGYQLPYTGTFTFTAGE